MQKTKESKRNRWQNQTKLYELKRTKISTLTILGLLINHKNKTKYSSCEQCPWESFYKEKFHEKQAKNN